MKMEIWYYSTVNEYRLDYQSKRFEFQHIKCQEL